MIINPITNPNPVLDTNTHDNMVAIPTVLAPENDCAGEGQQQL
jgi:hypothetical protein